jgi:hypothetical protein
MKVLQAPHLCDLSLFGSVQPVKPTWPSFAATSGLTRLALRRMPATTIFERQLLPVLATVIIVFGYDKPLKPCHDHTFLSVFISHQTCLLPTSSCMFCNLSTGLGTLSMHPQLLVLASQICILRRYPEFLRVAAHRTPTADRLAYLCRGVLKNACTMPALRVLKVTCPDRWNAAYSWGHMIRGIRT